MIVRGNINATNRLLPPSGVLDREEEMTRFAQAVLVLVALGVAAPAVAEAEPGLPCMNGQAAIDELIGRSAVSPVWKERPAGEGFSFTRLRIAEEGAGVVDKAREFLTVHRALWCVQDAALEVTGSDRSDGGSVVRAQLTIGGLPVVDAGLRLVFNGDDEVSALHSDMPAKMTVHGAFVLTPEEGRAATATAAPLSRESDGAAHGKCSAVYLRIGRRLAPAYRCALVTPDIVSSRAVFVSAGDGQLLAVRPLAVGRSEVGR